MNKCLANEIHQLLDFLTCYNLERVVSCLLLLLFCVCFLNFCNQYVWDGICCGNEDLSLIPGNIVSRFSCSQFFHIELMTAQQLVCLKLNATKHIITYQLNPII
ncbi:hypothetical protein ACKWTF_009716 [Chironomus riparius]